MSKEKRGRETKYQEIDEEIAKVPKSKKLKLFEQNFKNQGDEKLYEIYLNRFYRKTKTGDIPPFKMLEKDMNMDRRRMIEGLDKILFGFKVMFGDDTNEEKNMQEKESKDITPKKKR